MEFVLAKSEIEEAVEEAPVPKSVPGEKDNNLTAEKVATVTLLNQLYTTFSSHVNTMKAHPELVRQAIKNFDTGYLWLKEAILVHVAEPVQEPTVSEDLSSGAE